MTAQELLKFQLDHVGGQLDQALEGLLEQQWDYRPCSCARSPRETVEHLCEAYEAFVKDARGEKHEWGTYDIEDKSSQNLMLVFKDTRKRAVEIALSGNDEQMKSASDYIALHDAYHVGQLCSARLEADPNWNPYVIYAGHG